MEHSEPDDVLIEEFRNLLMQMSDRHREVLLRFRLSGQSWIAHFVHVHDANKGAIFHDQEENEFIYVTDLSEISEFQLNKPVGKYKANFPYRVMLIRFYS
jgi:hypothetical protein